MSSMDQLGMNFTADGSTMSRKEVEKQREKKGECITCGQKLYERKMFQKVPLTINGLVLNGRCLNCKPISSKNLGANVVLPAAARAATDSDRRKMQEQQVQSSRRGMRASSRRITSSASTRLGSFRTISQGNTPSASSRSVSSSTSSAKRSTKIIEEEESKHSTTSTSAAKTPTKPPPAQATIQSEDANGGDDMYKSAIGKMAAQKLAKRMLKKHREDQKDKDDELSTVKGIILTMQKYINDSSNIDYDNLFQCFKSLNSLLEDKKVMQHDYIIILQLLSSISNDNNDNKIRVMLEAIKCIHIIASTNPSVITDNKDDMFDSIVTCYSKMQSADLTASVLETISLIASTLTLNDSSFMNIIANECKIVIPYIIQCMNTYLENIDIQTKACIAISHLTELSSPVVFTSLKDSIIKGDGFNSINIAMMMHGSESDFLSHALSTLRHLCKECHQDNVKLLIAESGGIDNAIRAMQDHRDAVDVQEKGCWAISTLATLGTNDIQNYKIFIGDLGGIDVIVRALWVHMDNMSLVQEGMQGLWTLSVENANRDRMVEIGAVTVIVSCMRAHQGNELVQSKSCGIFANICANNDNHRIKIVNEEGLDVIIMAMILHSESKNVQNLGVNALKKLTSDSTVKVMRECGVDGVLISAKEKFPLCTKKADYILNFNN